MRKFYILIISLLAALMLSGCSEVLGKSNSETINIAFLGGLTGWLGQFSEQNVKSLQLAVEEINEAGGVLDGKKVKLVEEDTQSKIEGTMRGFQKVVHSNDVVSIIGPETESMLALLEHAKSYKTPIMSAFAGATELDDLAGDYAFRTAPSDTLIGEVRAHALIDQGIEEIAILTGNYEGAESDVKHFIEVYQELGGTVLTNVRFNLGQQTYNGELRKVAAVDPEMVYYSGDLSSAPIIFKAAEQMGYGWEWYVTPDVVSDEFIDITGADTVEGVKTIVPMEDADLPAFQHFIEGYEEKFGSQPASGFYNAHTYDLLIVSALAIEAAGEASGEAIDEYIREVSNEPGVPVTTFEEGVKELRKGNDINYEGASGPVDFDEYGSVLSSYGLTEIRDGDWELIDFFPAEYLEEK